MSGVSVKRPTVLFVALSVAFLLVLIRTAWVADDAYITFRTVQNFLNGHGLRWNIDERVQTYTHPLWMLLLSLFCRFTGEPYFTSMGLSIALSIATVNIVQVSCAGSAAGALMAMVCLTLSRAFVDYSTSGLENPLTHVLLAAFLAIYLSDRGNRAWPRRIFYLTLLSALVMTNRLDAALLVVPALALELWESRGARVAAGLPWGLPWGVLPLAAWEVFSVVYYGFPFPNTAYAKLQTGVPKAEAVKQGLLYLNNSLNQDPLTLAVIVAVGALVVATGRRRERGVMAGIGLYVAYVVWIGGDFMSGRLLAAPFLCAVVLMTRLEAVSTARDVTLATASAFAVLIGLAAPHPTVLSNASAAPDSIEFSGIADERLYYYPVTGLLRMPAEGVWVAPPETNLRSAALQAGKHTVTWAFVGMTGYDAGPTIHVIDPIGLGDPLLARLPARPDWRVGHYRRDVPAGYEDTVESGINRIQEPAVAALYDRIHLITSGPIWSWARARAILRMNLM